MTPLIIRLGFLFYIGLGGWSLYKAWPHVSLFYRYSQIVFYFLFFVSILIWAYGSWPLTTIAINQQEERAEAFMQAWKASDYEFLDLLLVSTPEESSGISLKSYFIESLLAAENKPLSWDIQRSSYPTDRYRLEGTAYFQNINDVPVILEFRWNYLRFRWELYRVQIRAPFDILEVRSFYHVGPAGSSLRSALSSITIMFALCMTLFIFQNQRILSQDEMKTEG